MTKTNRQKYSEAIKMAEGVIRQEYGHLTICETCGASGETYLDGSACKAALDAMCPGFKFWDGLRSEEIERQLKMVGLDIFGDPIK